MPDKQMNLRNLTHSNVLLWLLKQFYNTNLQEFYEFWYIFYITIDIPYNFDNSVSTNTTFIMSCIKSLHNMMMAE
jgi:hypothetical protein